MIGVSCRPLRGLGGCGTSFQGLTPLATPCRPYGTKTSPRSGRQDVARRREPLDAKRINDGRKARVAGDRM